jgi:hypothetical protein
MRIGGISLVQLLGIINFMLILFQLSSGLRWIQVKTGTHRKTGLALVLCASLHGLLATVTAH